MAGDGHIPSAFCYHPGTQKEIKKSAVSPEQKPYPGMVTLTLSKPCRDFPSLHKGGSKPERNW